MEEEIQGTGLPMTHSFIYNGKRFPFNMNIFECFSQYFLINKNKIKANNEIDLLDEGEYINGLSETSVNDFVKYCQQQVIRLNKENAFFLCRLSKKYEVELLLKASDKFMKANHQYFVIQFLSLKQEQNNFESEEIEELISSNLMNYIEDDQLFNLPIHVLYRIVSKYQEKNENKNAELPKMIEFLFRCLDHFKRPASIFFEKIDFGQMKNEVYRRLLEDYSKEFDFHFINKTQLQNLYELSNEIIASQEMNKITNEQIELEQTKIREEMEKMKEEIEQSFVNKIEEIDRENERKISLQQQEIRKLTEKVAQQANIIDQLSSQIKDLMYPPINCDFMNESNPNGIISHFYNSVILSAGGKHNPNYPISFIKDNNYCQFYNNYNYTPSSESDSYIKFDFGNNNKIELSSYFIRTNASLYDHTKSWRVEGSNDDNHWTRLDHRVNDGNLYGSYRQHYFDCQENRKGDKNYRFRYIQWIQEDSSNRNPYCVNITYIELYGKIFNSE